MAMFTVTKFVLIRNLAIFFIAGNTLYHLFPFPPIIWRIGFVLLAFYCTCLSLKHKLLGVEKSILAFVALNLVYFFISFLWITPSTTQIGNTLYALLGFNLFVLLGTKGVLTGRFFSTVATIIALAGIPYFYHAQKLALENLQGNSEEVTNNASVIFLMLLPMLFFVKHRLLSLGLFCICIFFLFIGAKRGNILAAAFPIIVYVYSILKDSKKSIGQFLCILILITGVIAGSVQVFLADEFLIGRFIDMQEGNSSGRNYLYANAWNLWVNSNDLIHYIFGYGFQGTLYNMGKMAHNDWLEILVDYGLLGGIFYLAIFVSFALIYVRMKRQKAKTILLVAISIWFLKTLYSMGFMEETLALLFIPLGQIVAEEKMKKEILA